MFDVATCLRQGLKMLAVAEALDLAIAPMSTLHLVGTG
jgi:hypothetical protein